LPYVEDALVESAEAKTAAAVAEYASEPDYTLVVSGADNLYLYVMVDAPDITCEEDGCGTEHEHIRYFMEPITNK